MREPPKMTQSHGGEQMPVVVCRFVRELNEVTAWIAEAVAPATHPEPPESPSRDNPMGLDERVWHGRRCPDCTGTQPCERARELIGG